MPDDDFTELTLLEAEERMQKSLDSLKRDFAAIRSTRASSNMVDHIMVDYYGVLTPINQVAGMSVPEPRMLLISPFDKSSIGDVEKAILKSDLGISPQNDGDVIRIILPELSMERRQELVKQVHSRLEECRIAIRNIRRDTNDLIKKQKAEGLSEDEIKSAQDDVQKLTDQMIKSAEAQASQKEESILTV